MFYFEEKQNLQWSKLGPRAMFGKFMLDSPGITAAKL